MPIVAVAFRLMGVMLKTGGNAILAFALWFLIFGLAMWAAAISGGALSIIQSLWWRVT